VSESALTVQWEEAAGGGGGVLSFYLLYSVLVSYKLKKKASEMLLLWESRLQPESKQVGFASTERMYTKNNHKTLKLCLVASSF